MRIATMALSLLLAAPALSYAADPHVVAAPHGAGATAAHEMPYPHPALPPHHATWAGVVVIVIAGMFLAAMTIGPIVRANMPEEVPDAHSHDEHGHGDHDAAHGHGEDDAAHGHH